jgi:hypothetical protein
MAEPVRCGNPSCGLVLDEPENVPYEERQPCPEVSVSGTSLQPNARGESSLRWPRSCRRLSSPRPRRYAPSDSASPAGYHTMQRHGDVVGESILFGLGVAGLVAFWSRRPPDGGTPPFGSSRVLALEALLSYGLTTGREGVSSHQPSGSPPALSVVDSPFSRGTSSSRSARLCAPRVAWVRPGGRALTGAQLART